MRALRRLGWLLFSLLAIASAVVVMLFVGAAVPVVVTIAQGGRAELWFFGRAGTRWPLH